MSRIWLIVLVIGFCALAATAYAAEDVGAVVALRGSALIERDAKVIEAKLKDGILLKDGVETKERSKAKMLFIDDSVLTLGEKSKVKIREFLYRKDKGGKSIFNLIDGKMRSVVGKSEFEIHTPTAVAAARGTVIDFETGEMDGKAFTTITCHEGEVDIRNIDPAITGKVTLRAGMTIKVTAGHPLPSPKPAATLKATGAVASAATADATSSAPLPIIQAPPVNLQPAGLKTTPLAVRVVIP